MQGRYFVCADFAREGREGVGEVAGIIGGQADFALEAVETDEKFQWRVGHALLAVAQHGLLPAKQGIPHD